MTPGATASLGLAEDGGWWALGLSGRWTGDVFANVAMSAADTGRDQLAALEAHGHRVRQLPVLRDIDLVEDLEHVSRLAPLSLVAATWRAIDVAHAVTRSANLGAR